MNYIETFFSNKISLLMKTVIVISICGCLNLTACRPTDNAMLATIEGQRWTLEEIDGQKALAKSSRDGMGTLGKPFIEFDFTNKLFNAMASCNLITGKVKANGNEIRFMWETSTALGCREALMKQESEFIELLGQITRYEILGQTLHLYAEDRLVMKFVGMKTVRTNLSSDSSNFSKKFQIAMRVFAFKPCVVI